MNSARGNEEAAVAERKVTNGARVIIDCPDPYKPSQRTRRIGIIIGVGIFTIAVGASVLSALTTLNSLTLAKYFPWVVMTLLIGLVLARSLFWGRKPLPDADQGPLTDEAVMSVCAPGIWDVGTGMGNLARCLFARGVVGRCIRICHVQMQFPVQPLALPFEPVPLDQAEAGFANLLEQPGRPNTADELANTSEISSIMRRNVLLGGGRIAIGFIALAWLIQCVEVYKKWRVTWGLILWSLTLCLTLLGFGGRGAWTWRRQWLLVPGGVVTRDAKFPARNWQTHLFRNAISTLVLRNTQRSIWHACVYDGEGFSRAAMTGQEAQMLLRAWLSPLPTPPVERLSDLA